MSESKRVVLNSLEPPIVSEKTTKRQCKSIRISVILPESNEDKCPEFNYKDELAAVKKKEKHNGKTPSNSNGLENGLDPVEDDDDVRRIALEMEAKYGTTTSAGNKRKRKGKKDDYADIGMGYDEADSFIDNTDGYDEIIPQNVTTLHGGFYINSGALEFKTDDEASSEVESSSSSSSEESDNEERPKRKRILDTTDDDDSDDETASQAEKSTKLGTPKNSIQQAIKKKLFSQKKIQVKKRRLMDPSKKTVKDLLREKRHDVDMPVPQNISGDKKNENSEKDPSKENKTPMSISSTVTDTIESVIKQSDDREKSSPVPPANDFRNRSNSDLTSKKEAILSKNVSDASGEGDSSRDGVKNDTFEIVKLPENLQSDIVELIEKIKKKAFEYKDVGKVKFFSGDVNHMLLGLERKCRCLGKSSRVRVYEHLSPYVKCRKETLMRRAKTLVIEEDEHRLKKLVFKLKTHIDEVMPAQIRNHEKECQRVLQKKFSQEAVENEELKQLKNPRRRFHCPEEMKKLLKDMLLLKKKCLIADAKKKEFTQDNIEEQLSEYLKQNILILWPEGWMSMGGLTRLCNSVVKTPSGKSQSSGHASSSTSASGSSHHKHSSTNNSTHMLNSLGQAKSNSLSITPVMSNNNSNKNSSIHVNNVATSHKMPESIIKTAINYSKDRLKPDKIIEMKDRVRLDQVVDMTERDIKLDKILEMKDRVKADKILEMKDRVKPDKILEMKDRVKPDKILEMKDRAKPDKILEMKDRAKPDKILEMKDRVKPDKVVEIKDRVKPDKVVEIKDRVLKPDKIVELKDRSKLDKVVEIKDRVKPEKILEMKDRVKPDHIVEIRDRAKPEKPVENPPKDSGVIVVNTNKVRDDSSTVIPNNNKPNQTHCQSLTLTTTKELEPSKPPYKYNPTENHTKSSSMSMSNHPLEMVNKYQETKASGMSNHPLETVNKYQETKASGMSNRPLEMVNKYQEPKTSGMSNRPLEMVNKYQEPKTSGMSNRPLEMVNKYQETKASGMSNRPLEMVNKYQETKASGMSNHPLEMVNKYQEPKTSGMSNRPLEMVNKYQETKASGMSNHPLETVNKYQEPKASGMSNHPLETVNKYQEPKASGMSNHPLETVNKYQETKASGMSNHPLETINKYQEPKASGMTNRPLETVNKYQEPKASGMSNHPSEMVNRYPELGVTSSKYLNKSDGDDIQMVMENLKALQKLSSPHRMDTNSSNTSSPVSVISYNKNSNSAPSRSEHGAKVSSRSELEPKASSLSAKPTDFSAGYQDEFQKQFISSLSHLAANPLTSSKPNYRCS